MLVGICYSNFLLKKIYYIEGRIDGMYQYGYGYPVCCNNAGYNDGAGFSWLWIIIIVFVLFFLFCGTGFRGNDCCR